MKHAEITNMGDLEQLPSRPFIPDFRFSVVLFPLPVERKQGINDVNKFTADRCNTENTAEFK